MGTNKLDEALRENTHAHISRGDMKQPSEKEASRNARITNIIQYYISSNPDKTHQGIAFNYTVPPQNYWSLCATRDDCICMQISNCAIVL